MPAKAGTPRASRTRAVTTTRNIGQSSLRAWSQSSAIPNRPRPTLHFIACTLFLFAVALPVVAADESVARLGLFLGDGPEETESAELRRGADLAAQECGDACSVMAAAKGGQWSAGASELVRLVYSEGITAVLGPADSRGGHLAEQVVARAKGRFVLLTPWASDLALTQIKVPWFFRLVPDDLRQAQSLLEEIHSARGLRTLVAIVAPGPEFRPALEAMKKAATLAHVPAPREIYLTADGVALERFAADVHTAGTEAVLILAPPVTAANTVASLRAAGITLPFFGPLRLAASAFLDRARAAGAGMTRGAPAPSSNPIEEQFRARYRRTYGREPSVPAAYGYDGASVLIDALRSARTGGGEAVAAALGATRRDGVTGRIEFDRQGNRIGPAALSLIEHGRLQPLQHDRKGATLGSFNRLLSLPQQGLCRFDERIRS